MKGRQLWLFGEEYGIFQTIGVYISKALCDVLAKRILFKSIWLLRKPSLKKKYGKFLNWGVSAMQIS